MMNILDGMNRPAEDGGMDEQDDDVAGQWSCGTCTFYNSMHMPHCETCDAPRCETANGAASRSTTNNDCLDMFTLCRGATEERVTQTMDASFEEDTGMTMKIFAYLRDSRGGGKGEREIHRIMMKAMASSPEKAIHLRPNLRHLPTFGRWDDLVACMGTPLEGDVVALFAKQLQADKEKAAGEKPADISLLAKWFPSERKKLDRETRICTKVAKELKITKSALRKEYLAPLRRHLQLLETKMCEDEWDEIDFSRVPSVAMQTHSKPKNAFLKRCPERFEAWKEDLKLGRNGAKLNASQLFAHTIVKAYYAGAAEDVVLEEAWKQQVQKAKALGELGATLVLSDVSASMMCSDGVPMYVSIAMGILISTNLPELWRNNVMTFSTEPTWHTLVGATLHQQVKSLMKAPWGGTTDFQAVFRLILDKATRSKIPSTDMPTRILVISDMQFNTASRGNSHTNFEAIDLQFRQAGYARPRLVFWNVNGQTADFPTGCDEQGVSLISGFSIDILKAVLGEEVLTPYQTMVKALEHPRFDVIRMAEEATEEK
jgi:hypothetical protein